MTGVIFDIKEMAVHDGPGIRTTLFLKGCPLRCAWCHNPEGFSQKPQLMYKKERCISCGRCKTECGHDDCREFGRCIHVCPENCLEVKGETIEADALSQELVKTADVLGNGFGGFTFSGGEPLLQHEFLLELSERLSDYHLCIETSGYADKEVFEKVLEVLDLVIMDIKLADDELHRKYTGVSNEKILANLNILKKSGKKYIIRTPLIPGITDTEDNLTKIRELIGDSEWERLPYNEMADAKYKMLGMEYGLKL